MNYLCVCLFSVEGSIKCHHKVCTAAPGVLAAVTVMAQWNVDKDEMGRSLSVQSGRPNLAESSTENIVMLCKWLDSEWAGKNSIFGKGNDFKVISHCCHSMWWPQVICEELLCEIVILTDFCLSLFSWQLSIWLSFVTLGVSFSGQCEKTMWMRKGDGELLRMGLEDSDIFYCIDQS